MTGFTREEIVTMMLALSLLQKFTDTELAKARKAGKHTKVAAMAAMLEQITAVRAKLVKMQVPS